MHNYLMQAVKNNNIELTTQLLKKGADPNIQNEYGNTALIWASCNDHIEMVRLLLEAGADPNIQNEYGKTALIWASCKGHIEIVRLLLEAGADPNFQNESGRTALMSASTYGHTEIVWLLLEAWADPYLRDNYDFGIFDYIKSTDALNLLLLYSKIPFSLNYRTDALYYKIRTKQILLVINYYMAIM